MANHARGGPSYVPFVLLGSFKRAAIVVAEVNSEHLRVGQWRVRLLGGFEFFVDDELRVISLPAQRLIAFLALNNGSMVERTYVAGTLWPDSSETAARSNLRSALSSLGPLRSTIVEVMPRTLQLGRRVLVDLHERREKAHQLLDPSIEGEYPFAAFAIDLLPHWDEVWVEAERESYRQLRLHVLENLSERSTRQGRFAEAIESALLAVEEAPLRESSHLALIRAVAAEGNHGEALKRYTELCALLDRELGVDPSFQIDDLLRSVEIA